MSASEELESACDRSIGWLGVMRWRAVLGAVSAAIVGVVLVVAFVRGDGQPGGVFLARVAQRVEEVRGLRFVRRPTVEFLDSRGMYDLRARLLPPASEVGARASDFVRRVPAAELPLVERLEALELLGAVPRGTTLQTLVFGAAADPGGLFDPSTGKIYVRRSTSAPGGVEDVIVHELTHALEYQHDLHSPAGLVHHAFDFDYSEASRSLIEGPATLMMYLYGKRFLGFHGGLDQFLSELQHESAQQLVLPPFVRAGVVFPYVEGAEYTDRLLSTSAGWGAVSAAERHPPSSTQQLLQHENESHAVLPLGLHSALGAAWRPEPPISFGDFDTSVLLQRAQLRPVPWIQQAWRGGSIKLWQDLDASHAGRCRRPCAAHFALVAIWRWRSAKLAARVASTIRGYLTQTLGRVTDAGASQRTRVGSVAVVVTKGTATALVLAPRQTLGRVLAGRIRSQLP